MPELPEVQNVVDSLSPGMVGRRVCRVIVRRRGVIHGADTAGALLQDRRIGAIVRLGKQLAFQSVADDANEDAGHPCVCIHLGMSGTLRYAEPGSTPGHRLRGDGRAGDPHVHVMWVLDDSSRVFFRDPRRFGGIWTYRNTEELWARRWSLLGPDALRVTPRKLHGVLHRTGRGVKAALLDQRLIAGLGNIYVDEVLFASGVHPLRKSNTLTVVDVRSLARYMRVVLRRSIRSGGSTLRDYVAADGRKGTFQASLHVYGRGGLPCSRCSETLCAFQVASRTTVYCPRCQGCP